MDVRIGLTHTIFPHSSRPVIQVDRSEVWGKPVACGRSQHYPKTARGGQRLGNGRLEKIVLQKPQGSKPKRGNSVVKYKEHDTDDEPRVPNKSGTSAEELAGSPRSSREGDAPRALRLHRKWWTVPESSAQTVEKCSVPTPRKPFFLKHGSGITWPVNHATVLCGAPDRPQ